MFRLDKIEWPTVWVLLGTYVLWVAATVWVAQWSIPMAMLLVALTGAQHSSLQHEVLHGHPTPWKRLNEGMVFPALTIAIPYIRFRDSHIEHHRDSKLTDPYDDPETNFQDPKVWARLSKLCKLTLTLNNTLAGRMLVGPMIAQFIFMRNDLRAIRAGQRTVLWGWIWHVPAVLCVVLWGVYVSAMPLWAFLVATYASLSILKVRTYLEHRAHEDVAARTVVIEDRGLLSLLFLNNNLHVVHHMHPGLAWYQLPTLYFSDRDFYLAQNESYRFKSYSEIFRKFFLRAKDPVPHPLWSKE